MPLTIREQSDQLKAAAAERLPAEVLEVFDRSIQDLLDQGIPTDEHQGRRRARTVHPRRRHREAGQPRPARRERPGGHRVLPGRVVPLLQSRPAHLPAGAPPPAGRLRCPAGRHQPAVTRRVALHAWKRPPWSSPSSPIRAVVWPIGSASRSSKPTMSSPPSASSVST